MLKPLSADKTMPAHPPEDDSHKLRVTRDARNQGQWIDEAENMVSMMGAELYA
jgi:hypothetical protein